jgi:putative FmdB family regulatory protein
MPIYEYSCQDCFHDFEIMQKVSEEPVKACPSCGKERVKKLVSAPQFKLKGTGWYETDFKNKPKAQDKQADTKKETTKTEVKKTPSKDKDS